ncbi:hypothetical protein MLD38_037928 [Melastoma candidum]|uniref:Uncharacterized protein n=1 Tax=Melastoma candidum TaxID=119954 RepID=A0ACB9KYG3_9MYRT|nr:hypothetical protein MLD38_037928 [Melastoma candidum]
MSWDQVPGLEDQQRNHLKRLCSKGVLGKNPKENESKPVVFLLGHNGEVSTDGNYLFTAVGRGLGLCPGSLGGGSLGPSREGSARTRRPQSRGSFGICMRLMLGRGGRFTSFRR